MKKIKLFLCVALLGAMSFGSFSVYEHYTMSAEEMALLENVEALTSGEHGAGTSTPNKKCPIWNVSEEKHIGIDGVWIHVSCTTGGSWKCMGSICPHGV